MKTIPVLMLIFHYASAATGSCGQWDQKWTVCKEVADCKFIADECGVLRTPVNKQYATEGKKFSSCRKIQAQCPESASQDRSTQIIKCEAYSMTFSGVKSARPVPTCMRLSSIVDMAINNDDLARIEAAVDEAKDVDMSLSHIHETPLSLAAMNAKSRIVKWLLEKGAKPNFRTTNGYTALIFAAMSRSDDKKGVYDTVALLLKAGVDKSLRNDRNETAMDLAIQVNNKELVNLLK